MVIQCPTVSSVEEGPYSGEVACEAKQVDKDVESVQAPISSVVQDPGATQTPVPKDPKPGQTPNLARTVIVEQVVELVLVKESFGATTSSARMGRAYLALILFCIILTSVLFIFPVFLPF